MFETTTVPLSGKAPASAVLRIKGMVCQRCIEVVRNELTQAGFPVLEIELGQVIISLRPQAEPFAEDDKERIRDLLARQGFSLLEDQPPLSQRVRAFLTSYFAQDDLSESRPGQTRLSVQLQQTLGIDYALISSRFAKAEGITLEKYIIQCRLNKVKELLVYSDETLTEIAYRTGYSSVQHLSNQFRQQTGLTPSHFRQLRQQKQALQSATAQSVI